MKNKITLLLLLILSYNAFGQYDAKKYNQVSIEIAYNSSVPYTDTDFKEQSNGNFTSFDGFNIGARYMFNQDFGLKAELAYNGYHGKNNLGTNFTRLDAQAVYNLGRLISLPYATNDKVGLLLHSGFGLSKSKSLYRNAYENIGNFIFGISPIFGLSDKIALSTDVTYVANFKQQYNYDGYLFNQTNEEYEFGYNLNFSIGLIMYLGQKTRHADWY